jgi:hypothetical protein
MRVDVIDPFSAGHISLSEDVVHLKMVSEAYHYVFKIL